jgi:hypothetical protein
MISNCAAITSRPLISIYLKFNETTLRDIEFNVHVKDYFSYAVTVAEKFEKQSAEGKYGSKTIEAIISTDFGIEELEPAIELANEVKKSITQTDIFK